MNEEWYAMQRQRMLDEIADEAAGVCAELGKLQFEQRVLTVMGRVPRHLFVPDDQLINAYLNSPVPIGYGKTISQPFIVALMTDLLDVQPDDLILEIGCGLGYQTSILSQLARQICSVELIEGLAVQARERLARLGCTNVEIRVGNGYLGWPEYAPYDKVIVTAAPQHIPQALLGQLKNGGRMVLPVGSPLFQQLLLVCKNHDGKVTTREILPVIFSALEQDLSSTGV